MAPNPLQSALAPIRARLRTQQAINGFMDGLSLGTIPAIILQGARVSTDPWLTPWPGVIALVSFSLIGALIYSLKSPTDKLAAALADTRCNLQDRTITALEIAALSNPTSIQSLALADAQSHLAKIDPRQVVPFSLPSYSKTIIIMALLTLAMIALPPGPGDSKPAPRPQTTQAIQDEAEKLLEDLKKAEEIAATQNNPELKKLAQDLKTLAQEIKDTPSTTPREALSKLSEMQNAIREEQAKYNTPLNDKHLKALGQALASNASTAQAGKALEEGKNQEAAKALDEKTALPDKPEDRKKLAQDLKDTADKMQDDGLADLAQATRKLGDAARENSAKDFAQGARSLGKLARQQDQRKKNDEWMNNQLAKLNDAKEQASQADSQNSGSDGKSQDGQQQAAGNQAAQGDQQAQGKAAAEGEGNQSGEGQGNKPKQTNQWGTGAGDNPLGDPTKIDAKRQQDQLTGKLGDSGESESQTTHSSQGKDQAKAAYRETHRKYQKISESVLESEPLPIGQRQAIRKYFEAIRPADESP